MAKVNLTLPSKTKASLTLAEPNQLTWDEADFTWDEADGTWNRQGIISERPSKTKASLSLPTK